MSALPYDLFYWVLLDSYNRVVNPSRCCNKRPIDQSRPMPICLTVNARADQPLDKEYPVAARTSEDFILTEPVGIYQTS
jgi:hypothetical protein